MNISTPAQAYWRQRGTLSERREHLLALSDAVGRPTDLPTYQWAQLMAFGLEFRPDIILELGRGWGNSTCAFTEIANQLKPNSCTVLSLGFSNIWMQQTLPKIGQLVPETWFQPLQILQEDILTFDYKDMLAGFNRIMIFWDAHGYDIAECVLGRILPEIADRHHIVIMHDLSDVRYLPESNYEYGEFGLWKGNNWNGPRLKLGTIDTAVEQAVAIVDFTSRNKLSLYSSDHSFYTELGHDEAKIAELREALGDDLFSLNGHWHWFSLNEKPGPCTFPVFYPSKLVSPQIPLRIRLKIALKILLNRYPLDKFVS